jgi:hypothetical protein
VFVFDVELHHISRDFNCVTFVVRMCRVVTCDWIGEDRRRNFASKKKIIEIGIPNPSPPASSGFGWHFWKSCSATISRLFNDVTSTQFSVSTRIRTKYFVYASQTFYYCVWVINTCVELYASRSLIQLTSVHCHMKSYTNRMLICYEALSGSLLLSSLVLKFNRQLLHS